MRIPIAFAGLVACGGEASRIDAIIDAPRPVDARVIDGDDAFPQRPRIAHDWDVVFDDGVKAIEDTYPRALVIAGDRIVSFGSGADHLLTREGELVARREDQVAAYFASPADEHVVAVTPADDGSHIALRTITTNDLSTLSTVECPADSLNSLGAAFGIDGAALGVVWEFQDGDFRLDQYAVGDDELIAGLPVSRGSIAGVRQWRALRRGAELLFVGRQGGSNDQMLRADLASGEVEALDAPIPGVDARLGVLVAGDGRAFYVGVADGMTHVREIDVVTWNYIGDPRAATLISDYAISVWGDYLVWIAGGEVTAVPLGDSPAPALTGDITLEPPDHINSSVPMAITADGTDAYVVFQSYIGGGPSRLHLRKLTYPPTVLSP